MSTKPSTLPRWADGGSAEVTAPESQQQDAGWVAEDIPPHQTFNWFWNLVYQWIAYFKVTAAKYETLEAAVDALSAGDTCIVDEHDLASGQGSAAITVTLAGGARGLTVDGKGVIALYPSGGSSVMQRLSRADLTTVLATYTMAGTEISKVVTNGTYVIAMTSLTIRCYAIAGGAPLWTYTHDGAVTDIAIDGVRAYLVGAEGASNRSLRALTLASGAVAWSYRHGATLNQVVSTGRNVYVGGTASGFASGATHRSLEAATGNDFDNEGASTAVATDTMVWNKVASLTTKANCMVSDGRRLYVGFAVGGANEVESWSLATGATYGGVELGVTCRALAVDQDFLYVAIDANPGLAAYDKKTLQMVWNYSDGATPGTDVCVASDSAAVFFFDIGGQLRRLNRGNRPKIWRRVAPTDNYLPYRQLLIPEE